MKRTLAWTLFWLLAFHLPATAKDADRRISIIVENHTAGNRYFEVVDDLSRESVPRACRLAGILVEGEKCRNGQEKDRCKEASEMLESPLCMPGILFHGRLESGETVPLEIRADSTGSGRIRVRNSLTAPWSVHSWVKAGDVVLMR